MNNTDHILLSALNLSLSDISSIDTVTDTTATSYYIKLARSKNVFCPICNFDGSLSKGTYSKKYIVPHHLFENADVFIKIPRYICKRCGKTFSTSKTFTPPNSSISFSLIIKVMQLLTDPKLTFKSVASLTGISQSSVMRIFDKYCHISKVTFPEVICIDEVYTKNNDFNSKYSCIIYDFIKGTIVDVLPARRKDYLSSYFDGFVRTGELNSIKFVSIDMYVTYKLIAKKYFKKAIICVDSFHVIQLLNNCLSSLRIRLMNSYSHSSKEYYLLKNWKNLLFTSSIDINHKKRYNSVFNLYMNYYDLLEKMLSISDDLRNAYILKEAYMRFNRTVESPEAAREKFPAIYNSFVKANIKEFYPFVVALSNWSDEIINSFTIYKGRRINSSVAESVNSKISELIYNTKGIRDSKRRKKRIMYCINKSGFTL